MDKVHFGRHSRIVPLHHDRASALRDHRPSAAFLLAVPRYRAAFVGRRGVLLCPLATPHCGATKRLRLEVVSTHQHPDYGVLGRAHGLSSYRRTYYPAPYHIVQEIQKFNLSDYRPRQEQ